MSYRTYINGHEWLGNNVIYYEIFDELARQGCPFDEEDCVYEPFEVKDLDGLVKACEKTIIRLIQENNEVANFKPNIERAMETNDLTFILQILQDTARIFISVNLLKYYFSDNCYILCRILKSFAVLFQARKAYE